jgi:ADP-ribosylglycohydrolase
MMSYKNQFKLTPSPLNMDSPYFNQLRVEYNQCLEEGLDVEKYKDLVWAVSNIEDAQDRYRFANMVFDVLMKAEIKEGYPYQEPSDLEGIRALRKPYRFEKKMPDAETLKDKILGAWYGRICGCLLGKPVEGVKYDVLTDFLKCSGNFPMTRYIRRSDIDREGIRTSCLAGEMPYAPWDDDTNYMVLAQMLIEKHGKDFTPKNVMDLWVEKQPLPSYYTAEKVALLNYTKGYLPPDSAVYQNPYREWIGAQIRGDYFGYINPDNPEMAAEMAFRDASISHVKNGIYGEMFVSAMLACAAVTDNIKDVIFGGLAEIPATSRLYEAILRLVERYDTGVSKEEAFADIHATWDDKDAHDWCHTISNALVVVASLLYGEYDYGRSICMAVETGFDTDCNGATVGSVLGMLLGEKGIGEEWKAPTHGILDTTISGATKSEISALAEKTLEHLSK